MGCSNTGDVEVILYRSNGTGKIPPLYAIGCLNNTALSAADAMVFTGYAL